MSASVARRQAVAKGLPTYKHPTWRCPKHPEAEGESTVGWSQCAVCDRERRKGWEACLASNRARKAIVEEKQAAFYAKGGYAVLRPLTKDNADAIPPWSDRESLLRFKEQCPTGMEIDHVVPLNGCGPDGTPSVCGLHVHYNLRYISKGANVAKSNLWLNDFNDALEWLHSTFAL